MDQKRLLQLAGVSSDDVVNLPSEESTSERVVLNEEYDDSVNISKVATSMPTDQMINLVAEHLWHHYVEDAEVEQFMEAVKSKLAENRSRAQ